MLGIGHYLKNNTNYKSSNNNDILYDQRIV